MNGVSQIIGALAPWRVLFIVCGVFTIAVGVVFIWLMPQDTTTAWFLNEREKEVATQRLAVDCASRDRQEFNWAQAKEAFASPFIYLFIMMGLCLILITPINKVWFFPDLSPMLPKTNEPFLPVFISPVISTQ